MVKQLKELELAPSTCDKQFLLAFTDGEDNSGTRFRDDSAFCELFQLLGEPGGICDRLTRIVVIAVGLTPAGLAPLKILSKTGKLKLISFERGADIQDAFEVASEEIERLSERCSDELGASEELLVFPTSPDFCV
jgi:hypothetical protein